VFGLGTPIGTWNLEPAAPTLGTCDSVKKKRRVAKKKEKKGN
jgi:hypothetical protein